MAHTPGPWKYKMRPPIEPGAIRDYADIDTADGTPVTVASFYGEDDDNEADARLITAAPELLEAAQAFDDWYSGRRTNADFAAGGVGALGTAIELARAAIAKAIGEQP